MLEIEKKFLVKQLPNLKGTEKVKIIQAYLNTNSEPTLRIRQRNDKYFLTYKFRKQSDKANMCIEHELPITSEAFNNLITKSEGIIINKNRYLIKLENELTAELDIFENELKGLIIVEVEFKTEEEAAKFTPPSWFGKEVTKDYRYKNSELSKGNNIKSLLSTEAIQ